MLHRLAICVIITWSSLAAPRSAVAANLFTTFDTIDAVEVNRDNSRATVLVTGLHQGGTTPVQDAFQFFNDADMAAQCARLATIVMSRPGKFRLVIGSHTSFLNGPLGGSGGGCRLVLRTP